MIKPIRYINLTNGIEFLDNHELLSEEYYEYNFIRIQSTHLEQKKFDLLIANLDSNFLMNVALGIPAEIIDYGSRRYDGNSRALWQGVEYLKYILNLRWFGKIEVTNMNCHQINFFESIYLNRNSKRKIDYFKQFLDGTFDKVGISYMYFPTDHDNDKEFFKATVLDWRDKNVE